MAGAKGPLIVIIHDAVGDQQIAEGDKIAFDVGDGQEFIWFGICAGFVLQRLLDRRSKLDRIIYVTSDVAAFERSSEGVYAGVEAGI